MALSLLSRLPDFSTHTIIIIEGEPGIICQVCEVMTVADREN
jgi:hypothetical protein